MTSSTGRIFVIWVTSYYPVVDHAVTDEEMAARSTENRGDYRALCGAVFLPAPEDRLADTRCPACVRVVRARATLPEAEQRLGRPTDYRTRHARPGWWSRFWRRKARR